MPEKKGKSGVYFNKEWLDSDFGIPAPNSPVKATSTLEQRDIESNSSMRRP